MSLEYETGENDERELSPEEFLAERKSAIRKNSVWAIGGGAFLTVVSISSTWILIGYFPELLEEAKLEDKSFLSILFRNILFLLGLFLLAGGVPRVF